MPKGFRTAHGAARDGGRLTDSSCPPADELKPATPVHAVRPDRDAAGRFVRNNDIGKSQRVRPRPVGSVHNVASLGLTPDPRFDPFRRWAKRYASHRRAELSAQHGGEISAGVGALIESASLSLAGSRYLFALAAAAPMQRAGTKNNTATGQWLREASRLAAEARASERDAWQLAALEAQARRGGPRPGRANQWWLQLGPGPGVVDVENDDGENDENQDEGDEE